MNIYARDLASGRITRISPGGGDTESSAPSPSHTGRQIAFESVALSVAPRLSQIYLRDLDAATTVPGQRFPPRARPGTLPRAGRCSPPTARSCSSKAAH